MPYLQRRVQQLIEDLKSGRLKPLPQPARALQEQVDKLEFGDQGELRLSSVSPELRGMARAYDLAHRAMEPEPQRAPTAERVIGNTEAFALTRQLFNHLGEFFTSVTGTTAANFKSNAGSFPAAVRALGHRMRASRSESQRVEKAFADGTNKLMKFYDEHGASLFQAGKTFPGLKMVLGGQQSFEEHSLAAARSMLLYTDTLLIPDPVYRWLEIEREDEAFRFPRMLEDAHNLLALEPLITKNLPYSALIVFPSWEGRLDRYDVATQDAQELMMVSLFGRYLSAKFDDITEIFDYARSHPDAIIESIIANRLLIAPNGTGDENWEEALVLIRQAHADSRSEKFREMMDKASDAQLAVLTIMERLAPQYHMSENATEMKASPLMSLPVHWHYFKLLADANGGTLVDEGVLSAQAIAVAKGILAEDNQWLGNVPIPALAELRIRGENERFRKKLDDCIKELGAAKEADLENAATTVGRALQHLLVTHNNEVRAIAEKYEKIYAPQAIVSWITLSAALTPFFPALVPSVALGLVATYLGAKTSERMERHRLGQTLTGVLAASARRAANK